MADEPKKHYGSCKFRETHMTRKQWGKLAGLPLWNNTPNDRCVVRGKDLDPSWKDCQGKFLSLLRSGERLLATWDGKRDQCAGQAERGSQPRRRSPKTSRKKVRWCFASSCGMSHNACMPAYAPKE
jgi:hypothetical protein